MRRLSIATAAFTLALGTQARAAGPEAETNLTVPFSQTANDQDVWAIYGNPAGLGRVQGLQLLGGGQRTDTLTGTARSHTLQVASALSLIDGLTVAGSVDALYTPAAGQPQTARTQMAAAIDLDGLAFGSSMSTFHTAAGATSALDIGMQLSLGRWARVGATVDHIALEAGNAGPETRVGISVRPGVEWLTLGLDGSHRDGAFGADASLRWQFTGGSLYGAVGNHGQQGLSGTAGLALDLEHAGVLGFARTNGQNLTSSAYARVSTTAFDAPRMLAPNFPVFHLIGPGALADDADPLFVELFENAPHPLEVRAALEDAAKDPHIRGVVLHLGGLGLGWGNAAEFRDTIGRLKAAGKTVVAYFDVVDDVGYFIASAADKVYVSPAGAVEADGLRATLTHMGGALAQLGIRADAVAAGNYKTGPRPLTADGPSPEEIEVTTALLDASYTALVDGIAAGRGLDPAHVRVLLDQGGFDAAEAEEAGLVDGTIYRDQLEDTIETVAGGWVNVDTVSIGGTKRHVAWASPAEIAVIPVTGAIVRGRAETGLFGGGEKQTGADDFIDAVDRAREDDDVAAIVIRIESGGGDALASDLMYHAVMRARKEKPVIASIGDVAASGGYYIAAAADEILAEPTSITGSIGVFALFFTAEQLARDLGVHTTEITRGALPGPTLLRGMTDAERKRLKTRVERTYTTFLTAVSKGQNLEVDDVRAAADGHVWTGAQAKERKLVTQFGGLYEALNLARARGGLNADAPVAIRVRSGAYKTEAVFTQRLARMLGQAPWWARHLDKIGLGPAAGRQVESAGTPQAEVPYTVDVR